MGTIIHSAIKKAWILPAIGVLAATVSCSKFDDYKKYVKDGERFYPGKPDTVIASAGHNRIGLAMVIKDPNVTTCVIHWNNGRDSLLLPVSPETLDDDTLKTVIPDLLEETYTFGITTFDQRGNRSVTTDATATAYGENYLASLLNRPIKQARTQSGVTYLEWYPAEVQEVYSEIVYMDKAQVLKTVRLPKDVVLLTLEDFKSGEPFRIRSAFVPDSTSMDTFLAAWEDLDAPSIVFAHLDKSKFSPLPLSTDIGMGWGWLMEYLWDGSVAEGRGFHTVDGARPYHFSFDLGVVAHLDELRVWMRQGPYYYGYGNPSKWEVWGSTNPAADGSFTGWTKLMDCASFKPSGLPKGNNSYTEADMVYANAGELFKFPQGIPAVRYLRFRILENWSDQASSHIMEIDLRGDF